MTAWPRQTQLWDVFACDDAGDRKRLTPIVLQTLIRLAQAWNLPEEQGAILLGMTMEDWTQVRAGTWRATLNQDQFLRSSVLIGIHKGLRSTFADTVADNWPRQANVAPLFAGETPVESMIKGGLPQMLDTYLHVEALHRASP